MWKEIAEMSELPFLFCVDATLTKIESHLHNTMKGKIIIKLKCMDMLSLHNRFNPINYI